MRIFEMFFIDILLVGIASLAFWAVLAALFLYLARRMSGDDDHDC